MLKLLSTVLVLCISCLSSASLRADVSIQGSLKKWHPLTVDISGATNPLGENLSLPHPFLDFRYDVIFTSPHGATHTVPGYFAGDGQGNGIGDVWRVKFSPDEIGEWQYEISFRAGKNVSVSDINSGRALPVSGQSGSFTINPKSKNDPGFLKHGRLEYVSDHYLKFNDGPYWIKGGIDSPENLFGYAGFDNTRDHPGGASTGSLQDGVHHYESHRADWNTGDPLFTNSQTPDAAKGIIGAINYLSEEAVNSVYFLPMNLGGDGRDTYPFIGTSGSAHDNTHYDISKLYQWDIVLNHLQNKGIAAHIVLGETEQGNTRWLDDGELGVERKLYYREMIARFSYLLAVKWNLSEESPLGFERHKSFANFIRQLDWANHPIAVHSHLNKPADVYDPILADPQLLTDPYITATSIQYSPFNANQFVEEWRDKSRAQGTPWVIDMDEIAPALTGLTGDNADTLRRTVLYPVYFSGGNLEWYFGYHALPLGGDLRTEDFRTREAMYKYMRYARELMQQELPFWEMEPADELHSNGATGGVQVFAKPLRNYAIYLPDGRESGSLNIEAGNYRQRWFNPRTGLFEGTETTTTSLPIVLGEPPNTPGQDWVVLLDIDNITEVESAPDATTTEPDANFVTDTNSSEEESQTSPVDAVPENEVARKSSSAGGALDLWILLFAAFLMARKSVIARKSYL